MPERGPRLRHVRRLGTPLPGLTRKEVGDNAYPPGQHGQNPKRGRKRSEYGRQLLEKQKLRLNYGVSERQLRAYLRAAGKMGGITGENLLAILERRLDNVVFRLGLAPTIPAARQMVAHGHVRVDGRRVDRAGYMVQPGRTVSLGPRAREIPAVVEMAERGPSVSLPGYLAKDPQDRFAGRMVATPTRADVPLVVDEAAVVEFYAR